MSAPVRQAYAALARIDRGLWLPRWLARSSDVIFRVALSLIFVIGGVGHFVELDYMLARIDKSPWAELVKRIGDPAILLQLSGAAFIVFGLLLAIGQFKRISALVLFVTLVPVTLAIHIAPGHMGPLLKNVAILGALLYVYCREPGPDA